MSEPLRSAPLDAATGDETVAPASTTRHAARTLDGPRTLRWLGWALLVAWASWWMASVTQKPLPHAVPLLGQWGGHRVTYLPAMPFLGLDFHHNYLAARAWHDGRDPYAALPGDPFNPRYTYPPLTLVAFSWTSGFAEGGCSFTLEFGPGVQFPVVLSWPAIFGWLATAAIILGCAAWQSWRARPRLGLGPLPLPFVLGAFLLSYPVLFELERGNCNTLPLLALLVAVWTLERGEGRGSDALVGLCVALATGIKPYAIVLLPGLIALRRARAALWGVGWLLLEAIVLWPDLRRWLAVAKLQNQLEAAMYLDYSHSVISHWKLLWNDLGLPQAAGLPAEPLLVGLLLIPIGIVGWRVWRAPARAGLAWPFLLWLAAMATMISPVAQDYNLLFVPLAVLSLWSARDGWRIQLCAVGVLVWCQPFLVGVTDLPWLLFKVASVTAVGALIVRRIEQPTEA